GIIVLLKILKVYYYQIREGNYRLIYISLIYSVLCMVPFLLWFKYVLYVESEIETDISYFARFQNNGVLDNLAAGIGLIKHPDVDNINGIPAFISLFLPIMGFRNWILSITLIVLFCWGYVVNLKNEKVS